MKYASLFVSAWKWVSITTVVHLGGGGEEEEVVSIGSIGLYFGLIDLFLMIDLKYMNSHIIGLDFIFYIFLYWRKQLIQYSKITKCILLD